MTVWFTQGQENQLKPGPDVVTLSWFRTWVLLILTRANTGTKVHSGRVTLSSLVQTQPQNPLTNNASSSHYKFLGVFKETNYIWSESYISWITRNTGLPWWCSGWESACQCRGHGFEPWSRKIPHATEQLGPWATTTEPACLEPVLRNKRGRDSERPAHHDEEWPPLASTRESPRTETKTQHSHK